MSISQIGRALTPLGFAFCLLGVMNLSWPSDYAIAAFSPIYPEMQTSFALPQFIASILTYAAWATNAWLRPVAKKLKFSITSSLVTFAGIASLSALLQAGTANPTFTGVAGILVGAGLSSSIMTWIRVFSTNDFYYSSTRIVFAVALAALLQFALSLVPATYAWWLLAVLVTVSCITAPACINSREFSDAAFHHRPCENKARYLKQFKRLWRPVLFALAAAVTWGVMQAYDVKSGLSESTDISFSLGVLLTSVTLAFLWSVFNDRFGFIRVFKLLTLVFLGAFLGFFALGSAASVVLSALASYAFALAWLLMLLICSRDAQNKEVHPFIAWGLFAALYAISADLLGYELGYLVAAQVAQATGLPLEAVIAMLCLAVFFIALYVDDRSASRKRKEAEKAPAATEDRLAAQCAAVAQEYCLSPRESEVLTLLARGRDVYHISEELFVSTSTVQFHCKNIYRKLDIHRKQDLITLVEGYGK